jgi:hypothetical protein
VKDVRRVFPTAYNPKDVENNWYSWWEKQVTVKECVPVVLLGTVLIEITL